MRRLLPLSFALLLAACPGDDDASGDAGVDLGATDLGVPGTTEPFAGRLSGGIHGWIYLPHGWTAGAHAWLDFEEVTLDPSGNATLGCPSNYEGPCSIDLRARDGCVYYHLDGVMRIEGDVGYPLHGDVLACPEAAAPPDPAPAWLETAVGPSRLAAHLPGLAVGLRSGVPIDLDAGALQLFADGVPVPAVGPIPITAHVTADTSAMHTVMGGAIDTPAAVDGLPATTDVVSDLTFDTEPPPGAISGGVTMGGSLCFASLVEELALPDPGAATTMDVVYGASSGRSGLRVVLARADGASTEGVDTLAVPPGAGPVTVFFYATAILRSFDGAFEPPMNVCVDAITFR